MKKIRVLCVVMQMEQGGLENRLMDIYRNIDREQIQFDFYICTGKIGFYDNEIKKLGGKVYYGIPLNIKSMKKVERQFRKFLFEHREYYIVHAHMNQWCGMFLRAAKYAYVPNRIAHARTSLQNRTIKNIVKNIIKLSVNRYATHRFAVSDSAGIWLYGKRKWKMGQVKVWANAIDSNQFLPNKKVRNDMRKRFNINDEYTLIHVGNCRPEKNHYFLLQIFRAVLLKEPNAKLILVGRDEKNICKRIAVSMKIDSKILFLGAQEDIHRILQAGDCFVFPSFYEGLPGAVVEAQAAGLPCVISDTITDEVCITPLITKKKLKESPKVWADEVLLHKNERRKSWKKNFISSGFEIHVLVEKLTVFYLRLGENR